MKQIQMLRTGWYIFSDTFATVWTWIFITHTRKILLNEAPQTYLGLFTQYEYFYQSILLVVLFWLVLFAIAGTYNIDLYKKYGLKELTATGLQCLTGSLLLLFVLFLNDNEQHYSYFYTVFFRLVLLQTLLVATGRLLLVSLAKKMMRKNPQLFNTIIIGNSTKATAVYKEIKHNHQSSVYNLLGFINAGRFSDNGVSKNLPCFGSIDNLDATIQQKNITQVVIALEKPEQSITESLISKLSAYDVEIKIVPDMLAIVSNSVKMNSAPGVLLIDMYTLPMALWQNNIKLFIDIIVSLTGIIVFSPLLLYVATRTKFSSEGNI